ncbi:MAG: DNA metabolism protein [Bacteroidia bacterium]|nr:MAG: DNA metabolism protein [Bacteroidia bacterium]
MNLFQKNCIFTYDGTLEGFFTVVFRAFQGKLEPSAIISRRAGSQIPLGDIIYVETSDEEANRVKKGLIERSDQKNLRLVHVAFLSGQQETDMLLWRYMKKLFNTTPGEYYRNMLDEDVYELVQTARRVKREVHRFQGFIRFQETKDNMYAAAIDPDNDIVRLLAPHFKGRYPDRQWLIYDMRRKYGIWFDLQSLHEVTFDENAFDLHTGYIRQQARAINEDYYKTLWQHYYDAINIIERKNHRQMKAFMPKRYWKYLPEKNKR